MTDVPDLETVARLRHQHDLSTFSDRCSCVVDHSHWNGDKHHGHDYACSGNCEATIAWRKAHPRGY